MLILTKSSKFVVGAFNFIFPCAVHIRVTYRIICSVRGSLFIEQLSVTASKMGCAVGTLKFVVFSFNFILVCLGFAMVLFGALDSPLPEDLANIEEFSKEVSLTSKVLIVAGAIIFLVAFFGCWGAVADSSCLLFLYAVFLMTLILVELAASTWIYLNRESSKNAVGKYLHEWIREYDKIPNAKTAIDSIQGKLKCCGVQDKGDWNYRSGLPGSCCENERGSPVTTCPLERAYQEGCLPKGIRMVVEKMKKYLYVALGIVGVELLTILFALIVRNSILNDKRRSLA